MKVYIKSCDNNEIFEEMVDCDELLHFLYDFYNGMRECVGCEFRIQMIDEFEYKVTVFDANDVGHNSIYSSKNIFANKIA